LWRLKSVLLRRCTLVWSESYATCVASVRHVLAEGCLHCGPIHDKVTDKIIRDRAQVTQNFNGTIHQVRFVVLDSPFLAKGLDELVRPGQVVSGHGGEEMVVDLVLQTTAEPVDKGLGETVSTNHVARGGDLQLPKVGTGVGVVGRHAVVSQAKDGCQEQTA
jgi:hypothetical protein